MCRFSSGKGFVSIGLLLVYKLETNKPSSASYGV